MKNLLILSTIAAFVSQAVGAETPVAGGLLGDQVAPVITKSGNGFVIAWQDTRIDGKGWGIGVQRVGTNLAAVGGVLRANSQTINHQEAPKVASFSDGSVVIVWQSGRVGQRDIVFKQLDASGNWLRSESFANTYRPGDQIEPTVKVLADNSFVVAWTSLGQFSGANRAIVAHRFSRSGVRLGVEIRVDDMTSFEPRNPELVAHTDGGFSAFWQSDSSQEQLRGAIRSRRFLPESTPAGASVQIEGIDNNARDFAVDSSGGYVDLLVKGTNVTLYAVQDSMASLVRAFPANQGVKGLAVKSENSSILASWSTFRTDRTGGVGYSIVIDRSNPTAGQPVRLSANPGLSEITPTIFRIGSGKTGAVWSKFRGNNGFDVVVNVN